MVSKAGNRFVFSVFVSLVVVVWAWPVLADTATLTFSGQVTEVSDESPPPFVDVTVGSAWSLTYTFETDAQDIDGRDTACLVKNNVTDMTLTIGTVSVSGPPGAYIPQEYSSSIAVNMNSGYADYSAQVGLPDAPAWASIAFYNYDNTPFANDSLPTVMPTPYEEAFPDVRRFTLRNPFETSVILTGEIIEVTQSSLTQVRADTDITVFDEYIALDLLVDTELYGEGGIASGMISAPGSEVMGVEPSPFKWVARNDQGSPGDGEVGLTIILDKQGQIMGFGESPFRVFLETDSGTFGEVEFDTVVGSYPGVLGDLDIGGLVLRGQDQVGMALDYVEIFDSFDQVVAGETRADFRVVEGEEYDYVAMIANNDLFGVGGVALGNIMCPGCEVMGVEPSPFKWVVDPMSGVPEDGEEIVNFMLNPGGEVMGVEPSPFRIVAVSGEEILGELDFSQVSGYLGSLHLQGIRIQLEDGSYIGVDDFDSEEGFVEIDIKPGSDINSINLDSSGVIPVAILSSLVFDATEINPETVRLAGAAIKLVGKSGKMLASVEDVDGDGLDDLMCKVLTDQLSIELGASMAVLEAETFDGITVKGQDSINIVSD